MSRREAFSAVRAAQFSATFPPILQTDCDDGSRAQKSAPATRPVTSRLITPGRNRPRFARSADPLRAICAASAPNRFIDAASLHQPGSAPPPQRTVNRAARRDPFAMARARFTLLVLRIGSLPRWDYAKFSSGRRSHSLDFFRAGESRRPFGPRRGEFTKFFKRVRAHLQIPDFRIHWTSRERPCQSSKLLAVLSFRECVPSHSSCGPGQPRAAGKPPQSLIERVRNPPGLRSLQAGRPSSAPR